MAFMMTCFLYFLINNREGKRREGEEKEIKKYKKEIKKEKEI